MTVDEQIRFFLLLAGCLQITAIMILGSFHLVSRILEETGRA